MKRRPALDREEEGTLSLAAHDLRDLSTEAKETSQTTVAYVGGAGRSGSTVLALLLAQLPGFVAVGGLTNLWERGLRQNYLCGCGADFHSCGFWSQVGAEAFGGWDEVDVDLVCRLRSSVTRYRHAPAYLAPGIRPSFADNADEYADYMARVYAAIASVSGARTVIDNSHDISPALLLGRMRGVQGRIVHLVRDSRGVAFSLARRVQRTEASDAAAYMPRFAPARASAEWLVANLAYHLIGSRTPPRLRIHYEALVETPAHEIRRIAEFLEVDVPAVALSVYEAESIDIGENHMVSGNPHRLGRRQVKLRLDDEWKTAMKPIDRLIVTALTLPLNYSYGYVGHPSWELPNRLRRK